jgi:hypothetical protein
VSCKSGQRLSAEKCSTFPDSGGAFKVQVYSPFILLNKTGFPFDLAAKTWTGGQAPIAGRQLFAGELNVTESTREPY